MSPVAVVVPPVALLPLAVAVLTPVAVVVPHVAVLPLPLLCRPSLSPFRIVVSRPLFATSSCHSSPCCRLSLSPCRMSPCCPLMPPVAVLPRAIVVPPVVLAPVAISVPCCRCRAASSYRPSPSLCCPPPCWPLPSLCRPSPFPPAAVLPLAVVPPITVVECSKKYLYRKK